MEVLSHLKAKLGEEVPPKEMHSILSRGSFHLRPWIEVLRPPSKSERNDHSKQTQVIGKTGKWLQAILEVWEGSDRGDRAKSCSVGSDLWKVKLVERVETKGRVDITRLQSFVFHLSRISLTRWWHRSCSCQSSLTSSSRTGIANLQGKEKGQER